MPAVTIVASIISRLWLSRLRLLYRPTATSTAKIARLPSGTVRNSNGGGSSGNPTAFRGGGDRDSGSHDEHRYRQQLYGTPALSPLLHRGSCSS